MEEGSDDVAVVELRGRIDTIGSREVEARLKEVLRGGQRRVVLDLRDTLYLSSAGFRVLLIAARRVGELEGRLVLSNLSAEVRRLFDLGAFTDLFVIAPSREEGIAACRD